MKVKLAFYFERVTNFFWLIPSVIILIIVSLIFLLKSFRVFTDEELIKELLLFHASPEGARIILGSIATSIMTVVGVVFSIIIVVLQQMSAQYSPRVVANFTRSTMAQTVLGLFVGTFIYCLLLLSQIGKTGGSLNPIPQLGLSVAVALGILCMLFLILYIHYVTRTIQSTQIISTIMHETLETLENIRKDRAACQQVTSKDCPEHYSFETKIISSKRGYIDVINWEEMAEKFKRKDVRIEFIAMPGDYIHEGMSLMELKSNAPIDEKMKQDATESVLLEEMRSYSQDPCYGIQKLSDIALRGLSPGINDPSTAIEAIHGISACFLRWARHYPLCEWVKPHPHLYIKFNNPQAERLVSLAYDQILNYADKHFLVIEQIERDLNYALEVSTDESLKEAIIQRLAVIKSSH